MYCFLFQILTVLQPDSGPGVTRDQQQETQNRLESGLHPVFKIENLQPGTQFRAVVFAKVRNINQYHQLFQLQKSLYNTYWLSYL